MDTDLYTRLMVGAEEIDLSSYPLEVVGATTNKIISSYLELHGSAVLDTFIYIDNIILTYNEP